MMHIPKYQEDMLWELNILDDMCEKTVEPRVDEYYDEQTWEKLDLSPGTSRRTR